MTAQSNRFTGLPIQQPQEIDQGLQQPQQQFQGFDIVFEEEAQPQQQFEGFDVVFEEPSPQIEGEGMSAQEQALDIGKGLVRGQAARIGVVGDLTSLVGRGFNALLNLTAGQDVDFDKIEKELKEKGLPGFQAQTEREFKELDVLQNPNASFFEKLTALNDIGSDNIFLEGFKPPTTREVQEEAVDVVTGGRLKPQTTAGEVAQTISEFQALGPQTGRGLAGAIGGGGAFEAVERSEIPEEAKPVAGGLAAILGTVAGQRVPAATRAGAEIVRQTAKGGVKKGLGTAVGSVISPKAIRTDLLKAAKAEGIDLPAQAVIDNSGLSFMENALKESGFSGQALQQKKQEVINQYVNSFKTALNEISEIAPLERGQTGESILSGLKQAEQNSANVYRQLYNQAENAVPQGQRIKSDKLASTINNLESRLKRSASPSPEQKKVLDVLSDFKEKFVDESGKGKFAEVGDFIESKVSVNDIVNVDLQGGSKKLLLKLAKDIKNELTDYGKKINPEFGEAYLQAEEQFAKHADTFRNDVISKALRQQTPEKLLDLGNDVSKLKKLQTALSPLGEEGEDLYKAFRRAKFEDKFKDKVISPKDASARFNTASTVLGEGKQTELIKELAGPEAFERLKRLQKVANGLEKGAQKFMNPSGSGARVVDSLLAMSIVKDIGVLLSGGPASSIVYTTLKGTSPKLMAELIADPKFVEAVIDMAKAGNGTNPARFFKTTQNVARQLVPKLQEAGITLEELGIEEENQ